MEGGILGKLNLTDQRGIVVLNAPSSFEPELRKLTGVEVRRALEPARGAEFTLAFATRLAEVESLARSLASVPPGDLVVRVAFPKRTSRRYTCEFDRDSGWQALGRLGYEAVRAVAVDEDWSALRFRRVEFIEQISRASTRAISLQGKRRAARREGGRRPPRK